MSISKIEDILLIQILKFLSPNDLLTTQLCSKNWKVCSNSSIIWSYYLDHMWIEYDEISQPTLLDRIVDEIPMDVIRQNVYNSIIFDESQYVVNIDYSRLFMGRLLLRNRIVTENNEKITLPDWSLNINLYKATYFFSKYESRRTSIFMSELLQPCRWRCYFKSKFVAGEEHGWDCSFLEDGTLLSAIHQTPMTWGVSCITKNL